MSEYIWEKDDPKDDDLDEKVVQDQQGGDAKKADVVQEKEVLSFDWNRLKYKSNLTTHQMINRGLVVLVLALIAYIVYYFAAPINQIDAINVNQTTFVAQEKIVKMTGLTLGEKYSLVELYLMEDNITDPSFETVSAVYDPATNAYNIAITELKPLAINNDGLYYYSDNGVVKSTSEMAYDAPKLIGFTPELEVKVVDQLNQLEYNIIKEIAAIELNATKISDELLLMTMTDGNYIEININQIAEKMPFYLQMQAIINSENKGKDGILHLNIGDYYEPL